MILDLNAMPYEVTKKGDVKRMRKEGKLPAILYGHKEKSKRIYVLLSEFKKILETLKKETVTVNLKINTKKYMCVIKTIQHNPVTSELLHVDFQHIHKKERIKASVPIHLLGEAPGVKEGGILDQHLHDVVVKCFPVDIPSHIDVDISALELGHTIHLSDIEIPNVEYELTKETTVISVLIPRAVAAEAKVEEKEEVPEEEEEKAKAEAPVEEGKEAKTEKKETGKRTEKA